MLQRDALSERVSALRDKAAALTHEAEVLDNDIVTSPTRLAVELERLKQLMTEVDSSNIQNIYTFHYLFNIMF